jgi:hypothetical protein
LQYIEKSLQRGYSLAALKHVSGLHALILDPGFRPDGK